MEILQIFSADMNICLLLSISCFMGQAFLLVLFRFLDRIFRNLRWSCWMTIFIGMIIFIRTIHDNNMYTILAEINIEKIRDTDASTS